MIGSLLKAEVTDKAARDLLVFCATSGVIVQEEGAGGGLKLRMIIQPHAQ